MVARRRLELERIKELKSKVRHGKKRRMNERVARLLLLMHEKEEEEGEEYKRGMLGLFKKWEVQDIHRVVQDSSPQV